MTEAKVEIVRAGPLLELAISGEVDLANAAWVHGQLLGMISNLASSVRIDLTDLTFLDSAGLRVMFALADRLDMLQIDLDVLVPPTSIPRRALELAGFTPLSTARPS